MSESARRPHPNDPDVTRHQVRMSAVKMSEEERADVLRSINRQIEEIDRRKKSE